MIEQNQEAEYLKIRNQHLAYQTKKILTFQEARNRESIIDSEGFIVRFLFRHRENPDDSIAIERLLGPLVRDLPEALGSHYNILPNSFYFPGYKFKSYGDTSLVKRVGNTLAFQSFEYFYNKFGHALKVGIVSPYDPTNYLSGSEPIYGNMSSPLEVDVVSLNIQDYNMIEHKLDMIQMGVYIQV